MRALAFSSVILAASLSQAVFAQTQAEAAAQNIQLAITLCVRNGHDAATLQGAFASSGHSYSAETYGETTVHNYGTPDGTVNTAVSFDGISAHCSISTDIYGVTQMIPFARTVLDQLYEGPIWDEFPEGAKIAPGSPQAANNTCSGFHILPGRTTIWFQFGAAGNDPLCIENGTAQIMISL